MKYEFYQEHRPKSRGRRALFAASAALIIAVASHVALAGADTTIEALSRAVSLIKTETVTAVQSVEERFDNPPPPARSAHTVGERYGSTLSMFRGNPTRSWYGSGAMPKDGDIEWRYPQNAMCSESTDKGVLKQWCGNGWTGQPVVYGHDGITEIIFGAYDKKIHFVDAQTGKEYRAPFPTDDIIKGSVTLDPNGYPLIYFGSRDNKLRIVSLEDDTTKELWHLDSKDLPGIWNDDWDANPVIIDDMLVTGGENGWFFVIKLNRAYDANGRVSVSPTVIATLPSYDDDFIKKVGDKNMSIENSVALFENTAYFANSGGRVLGVDLANVSSGETPIVFDFWAGDDIDASIVVDKSGMLYVSVEAERLNERSREVGQIMKLDPKLAEPLVWSVDVPSKVSGIPGGVWATPALHENFLYVPTNPGELLVIDIRDGSVTYRDDIGAHAWSSPIVSENELLVATCDGRMRFYDLVDPARPKFISEISIPSGSCIESTPALWNGALYFGARDGFFYKITK